MIQRFFRSIRWWTPIGLWLWACGACWFAVAPVAWLRVIGVGALVAAAVSWWNAKPDQPLRRLGAPLLAALLVAVIHFSHQPVVDAEWAVDHARHPKAIRDHALDTYTIAGVRTRDAGKVRYEEKRVVIQDIQRVWLGVQHFTVVTPIAHTFVSFELSNGERIAVSTEARRCVGESYSPLAGLFRAYGLIAVVGSEEEVTGRAIGPMAVEEPFPLYLYETVATPEQSQAMFVAVMQRVNEMRERPEFYNTLTNNCTTNIVERCNEVAPVYVSPLSPRIMLPGYTGAAAYRHGLLDTARPFADLRQEAMNAYQRRSQAE